MTTDPRHAYVRFYLTVLAQLDEVHAALQATAGEIRAAAEPFADVLATSDDADLQKLLAAPEPPLATRALWRPHDPVNLTGIVDVYEVVGRFTFQGEDDQNIARLGDVVRQTGAEIERQRRCIAALGRLPATATRLAEGLSQQEIAAAEAKRAELLKPFVPVAQQLREQCGKVLEAIRVIPRPDLSNLDQADANYQQFVTRMQSLYTKALPFLRRGLQELCAVAAVEVPPSWPETLPFAPSLPAELLTPPALDSPAMSALRAQLEQAEAQEVALQRAAEELAVTQRRIEAERQSLASRDAELTAESNAAKNVVRWAAKLDELDGVVQAAASQNQQKQSRVALVSQLSVQLAQLQHAAAALQHEISQREAEVAAASQALAKERANPPAIFGKDEWRRKVDELEQELGERHATLAQRQAVLAQYTNEATALQGRAQAEQAQIGMIDRALAEARAREEAVRKEIAEIEQQLGAHKPARRLTVQQGDEYLAQVYNARNEVRGRVEYLTNQLRHGAEQIDRSTMQARQIAGDKKRLRDALERATQDALGAREEALRSLALRRQSGFVQYVNQVLAPLEESLSQVDRIFIEPARQVLLQRGEGSAAKAGSLRAQAEKLAHAVAALAPRVEPVLATQAEVVKRVQSDFVEKAGEAVKSAWA